MMGCIIYLRNLAAKRIRSISSQLPMADAIIKSILSLGLVEIHRELMRPPSDRSLLRSSDRFCRRARLYAWILSVSGNISQSDAAICSCVYLIREGICGWITAWQWFAYKPWEGLEGLPLNPRINQIFTQPVGIIRAVRKEYFARNTLDQLGSFPPAQNIIARDVAAAW